MEAVSRKQALSVILELFECCFGSEKGSGDMYYEFMERMGLAEWDDDCEKCIKEPPGEFEFLLALGVQPQEFYDLMPGLNPNIFDDLMEVYHLTSPAERKEDGNKPIHNSGYTCEKPPKMPSSCAECNIIKANELCVYGDDSCYAALWKMLFQQ